MGGWILLCATMLCAVASAQEGYVLEGQRVLVESMEQWEAWQAPAGVHVIEPDGTVRPRFLRADINAVADAGLFSRVEIEGDTLVGGVSGAGSNLETAVNIIDGDERTFWEPDAEDEIDNWYVEIDLGRASVGICFAERGF